MRSAIDATSEVEIRDRISDFVIGVLEKPDASMLRLRVRRLILLPKEMPDLT